MDLNKLIRKTEVAPKDIDKPLPPRTYKAKVISRRKATPRFNTPIEVEHEYDPPSFLRFDRYQDALERNSGAMGDRDARRRY